MKSFYALSLMLATLLSGCGNGPDATVTRIANRALENSGLPEPHSYVLSAQGQGVQVDLSLVNELPQTVSYSAATTADGAVIDLRGKSIHASATRESGGTTPVVVTLYRDGVAVGSETLSTPGDAYQASF